MADQYFAFAPIFGLQTEIPYSDEASARVFQIAGDKHRCRLSLRYIDNTFGLDRLVSKGGIEILESTRHDPRWREITDPVKIAAIAAVVNWPAL